MPRWDFLFLVLLGILALVGMTLLILALLQVVLETISVISYLFSQDLLCICKI